MTLACYVHISSNIYLGLAQFRNVLSQLDKRVMICWARIFFCLTISINYWIFLGQNNSMGVVDHYEQFLVIGFVIEIKGCSHWPFFPTILHDFFLSISLKSRAKGGPVHVNSRSYGTTLPDWWYFYCPISPCDVLSWNRGGLWALLLNRTVQCENSTPDYFASWQRLFLTPKFGVSNLYPWPTGHRKCILWLFEGDRMRIIFPVCKGYYRVWDLWTTKMRKLVSRTTHGGQFDYTMAFRDSFCSGWILWQNVLWQCLQDLIVGQTVSLCPTHHQSLPSLNRKYNILLYIYLLGRSCYLWIKT